MSSRKPSAVSSRKVATPPSLFQRSPEVEEVEPAAAVHEMTSRTVSEPVEPEVRKEKKTFHLDSEIVILLSQLQFEQQRATGKKPNLSDLVEEGIRLLAQARQGTTDVSA